MCCFVAGWLFGFNQMHECIQHKYTCETEKNKRRRHKYETDGNKMTEEMRKGRGKTRRDDRE